MCHDNLWLVYFKPNFVNNNLQHRLSYKVTSSKKEGLFWPRPTQQARPMSPKIDRLIIMNSSDYWQNKTTLFHLLHKTS